MTERPDSCTRVLAAVAEIEQVLTTHDVYGVTDPEALALIEKAVFAIKTARFEPYADVHMKAKNVARSAGILYSQRRHGQLGGLENVAAHLRTDLAGIKTIVHGAQYRQGKLTTD